MRKVEINGEIAGKSEAEPMERLSKAKLETDSPLRTDGLSQADAKLHERMEMQKPAGGEIPAPGADIKPSEVQVKGIPEEEQIKLLTDFLNGFEKIKLENWKKMSEAERLDALQEIENKAAEITGRPALKVQASHLPAGVRGQMNWSTRSILINRELLTLDQPQDLRQNVKTLLHEGRHAYQFSNVYLRRTELNNENFKAWEANIKGSGYLSADRYGFRLYYMQPVEYDARRFSESVASKASFI